MTLDDIKMFRHKLLQQYSDSVSQLTASIWYGSTKICAVGNPDTISINDNDIPMDSDIETVIDAGRNLENIIHFYVYTPTEYQYIQENFGIAIPSPSGMYNSLIPDQNYFSRHDKDKPIVSLIESKRFELLSVVGFDIDPLLTSLDRIDIQHTFDAHGKLIISFTSVRQFNRFKLTIPNSNTIIECCNFYVNPGYFHAQNVT